jgi:hypothetical protein
MSRSPSAPQAKTRYVSQQPNCSNSQKLKHKPTCKPIPTIPPHIVAELLALRSSDPRVPSASSRREWAGLRQVDTSKIGTWFSRRKVAARKAGNPISEDTYELSLDPPPPPSATILVLSDIDTKKGLLSSLALPPIHGHGRLCKRIKIEELGSNETA